MSEINEVSLAIGRLQSTVESHTGVHSQILEKLNKMDESVTHRLDRYESTLQELTSEHQQRKGALRVVAVVASVVTVAFWKIVDHIVK